MKQSFLSVVLIVAGAFVHGQALAQDATTAQSGETAQQTSDPGAAPTTTEASTTETSTPPTLASADGTAAAAVQEEEADEAAAEEPEQRIWRGSYVWWDQSLSAYSLAPNGALTYNPTYAWNFRFVPRFYLRDDLFIAIREDIDVEITQSDSASYDRQPYLSDPQISLVKTGIINTNGFTFSAGPRLVLPLSIVSRANDVYFGLGGLISAGYRRPEIVHGLSFSFDMIYTHFFAGTNVMSVQAPYPCAAPDGRLPGRICDQTGGPSTVSDQVFFGPTASLSILEDLSVSFSFYWVLRRGRELADATIQTASGPVTLEDGSLTHWRNSTFVYASIAYQFLPWLSGQLNYWSFTPELNPNGSIRNPFFNYDSQISLTATVTLDKLYDELFGGLEDEHDPHHRPTGGRGGAF